MGTVKQGDLAPFLEDELFDPYRMHVKNLRDLWTLNDHYTRFMKIIYDLKHSLKSSV